MGIWQKLFGSAEPNAVLDKLISVYEERIQELKTTIEGQKSVITELNAKVLDQRKRLEMVPRMVSSPDADTHVWNPDEINDQPSFDAVTDLKQIKDEIARELMSLNEEHQSTVTPPVPVEA